jgi:hypothetical protein
MHRALRHAWLLKNLPVEKFKKGPVSTVAVHRIDRRQIGGRTQGQSHAGGKNNVKSTTTAFENFIRTN